MLGLAILPMMTTGCAIAVSDNVGCSALDRPATNLAAALAFDGGPVSDTAGRVVIATIDAWCGT